MTILQIFDMKVSIHFLCKQRKKFLSETRGTAYEKFQSTSFTNKGRNTHVIRSPSL
ncbi:hypothetical protein LEP1GSC041_2617 [Leptospira noguchii str. 2006001870]|nr:hypothetical protein LEP1GSC041_2617 [Leptospira noguchii str. 2006001870]